MHWTSRHGPVEETSMLDSPEYSTKEGCSKVEGKINTPD